ncbi:uncharacterized protein STEHIDRAFT_129669 [Stereum hirsutum FP-91666 SS1]|uniref:uncharacterized protein n=1 Tax=Stereum hirsutum (strain FP-91666) TaxID=721885 RepID=UPI000440F41F|nr:uncharacterized protein STEHIDRAFT_129669 [Stereum hirsutum FP-91666 SS1]EIM89142.1 hypothetical protein STEHIDRAFT_129669 [Stereum hirsutum FP-91666 SS1]
MHFLCSFKLRGEDCRYSLVFISAGRTNRGDRLFVALSLAEIALHSIPSVAVETLNGKREWRVNAAGCKIVRALQMDQYKVCGRPRSASHRVISLQHFEGSTSSVPPNKFTSRITLTPPSPSIHIFSLELL